MGKGAFVGLLTVVVVMVLAVLALIFVQRVEPGKVGVLIDYGAGTVAGKPSISDVPTGTFRILGPFQKLAKYDMSLQSLTMVRSSAEGQVKGDDSIVCRDQTGIQLNVDVTVLWRVDTANIGPLYILYPGKDLGTLGQEVVRRVTKTTINDICGSYGYADIMGQKRIDFGSKVQELLTERLGTTYVLVQSFNMGEIYPQEAQQTALTAKSVAEQQAQEAKFLEEKNRNEANANIAKAEGDKRVKVLGAEGDAAAIKVINDQLASSPEYIKWLYATNWEGMPPSTVVLNGDSSKGVNLGMILPGATPIVEPTAEPTLPK